MARSPFGLKVAVQTMQKDNRLRRAHRCGQQPEHAPFGDAAASAGGIGSEADLRVRDAEMDQLTFVGNDAENTFRLAGTGEGF